MKVERIFTGHGSHIIEPPMDQSWTRLQKLEWHAAAASHDSGLEIVVRPTKKLMPQTFMVTIVGHSGHSDRPYEDAWTLINGISSGASAIRAELAADRLRKLRDS